MVVGAVGRIWDAVVEVVVELAELVWFEGEAMGIVVVKFVVVVKELSCLFGPKVTPVVTEKEVMTV